jgi:hypothetical protein
MEKCQKSVIIKSRNSKELTNREEVSGKIIDIFKKDET